MEAVAIQQPIQPLVLQLVRQIEGQWEQEMSCGNDDIPPVPHVHLMSEIERNLSLVQTFLPLLQAIQNKWKKTHSSHDNATPPIKELLSEVEECVHVIEQNDEEAERAREADFMMSFQMQQEAEKQAEEKALVVQAEQAALLKAQDDEKERRLTPQEKADRDRQRLEEKETEKFLLENTVRCAACGIHCQRVPFSCPNVVCRCGHQFTILAWSA